MVYGEGLRAADDVVGHELTHGVTEFTSGLFYYAESGAINESMSDVMGELIDLGTPSDPDLPADRWQVGEDLPLGAIRSMSNPPAFGDPDRMTSPLFVGASGDSHGVHTNSGVNNKAAFLITDGGTFNGQTVVGLGLDEDRADLLPGRDHAARAGVGLPRPLPHVAPGMHQSDRHGRHHGSTAAR